MQNVHHPPNPPLDEEFWLHDTFPRRPDVAYLRKHFYKEGRLQEHQALWILEEGRKLMKEEPNVLAVEAPVTSIKSLHICSVSCRFDDTLPRSCRRYSWSICALPILPSLVDALKLMQYDLMTLMKPAIGGSPSATRYLFLGSLPAPHRCTTSRIYR